MESQEGQARSSVKAHWHDTTIIIESEDQVFDQKQWTKIANIHKNQAPEVIRLLRAWLMFIGEGNPEERNICRCGQENVLLECQHHNRIFKFTEKEEVDG